MKKLVRAVRDLLQRCAPPAWHSPTAVTLAAAVLAASATLPVQAATTPGAGLATSTTLSQQPVSMLTMAQPSMLFAIDDSGSMNWEVLLTTNQGEAYWQAPVTSALQAGTLTSLLAPLTGMLANVGVVDSTGTPYFGGNGGAPRYDYAFPFGDGRSAPPIFTAVLPPTADFAVMRNAAYNPIYYNPHLTYVPWAPSFTAAGGLKVWPQSSFTAAPLHPASTTTVDLRQTVLTPFEIYAGAVLPGPGNPLLGGGKSVLDTCAYLPLQLLPNGDYVYTAAGVANAGPSQCQLPFNPAVYYTNVATCPTNGVCVTAPDGKLMQQVIVTASSAEAQNYANWFTYYRTRITLLASSMAAVLPSVGNLHGGGMLFSQWQNFNRGAPAPMPAMYDFSATNPAANQSSLLSLFYGAAPQYDTPTVEILNYVDNLYQNDSSKTYIHQACQRNATMIVTDGFANDYGRGGLPSYGALSPQFFSYPPGGASAKTATAPYVTTYPGTLADVAAHFYAPTTPLAGGVFQSTPGLVPVDANPNAVNADLNPNLHVNMYAMTLGAKGNYFGQATPQGQAPFGNINSTTDWPQPVSNQPSAIDDLFHATINGRGTMSVVTDSASAITSIKGVLADLLNRTGAGSAVAVSSPNVTVSNNTAYLASFNPSAWFGDLVAAPLDLTTGLPAAGAPLWSLQANLDKQNWQQRLFATYSGTAGVAFPAGLSASTLTSLLASATPTDDSACVASYVMGDRSKEAGNTTVGCTVGNAIVLPYRARTHVLGDLVDAAPVVVNNQPTWFGNPDPTYAAFATAIQGRTTAVYQGGNDGMLHALDAGNLGAELWSYIPSALLGKLKTLVNPAYTHTFFVDATPQVTDVKTSSGWKTLLVGGLRAGGQGYYALDITNPASATTSAGVASKVLWEFPNAATASSAGGVGYAYGMPVIANSAAGWVVLVTSGYDNADNNGHLFALDPATGAVLADIVASTGTAAAPAGLAGLIAFAPDGVTAVRAYAGDLNGNLLAFDLSSPNPALWSVRTLATLTDASGAPQPVTTTPALNLVHGKPLVYVGTGRLLDRSDVTSKPQVQTVYAIPDDGVTSYLGAKAPHASGSGFLQQTITVASSTLRTASTAVVTAANPGWYVDLPSGEEITSDMVLAGATLVFNTNVPSTAGCSSSSYQYRMDAMNGAMQPVSLFPTGTTPYAGTLLGAALASNPVLMILPSGQVMASTHLSDGSVKTQALPLSNANSVRKEGWREIRQ